MSECRDHGFSSVSSRFRVFVLYGFRGLRRTSHDGIMPFMSAISRRDLLLSLPALAIVPRTLAQAADPPIRARALNHMTLAVSDPKRSLEFYQGLFGMPVQARQGPTTLLRIGSGPQFLALSATAANAAPEINHFCLTVDGFNADRDCETPDRSRPDQKRRQRRDESPRQDARSERWWSGRGNPGALFRRSRRHHRPVAGRELLWRRRRSRQRVCRRSGAITEERAARGARSESFHHQRRRTRSGRTRFTRSSSACRFERTRDRRRSSASDRRCNFSCSRPVQWRQERTPRRRVRRESITSA